MTLTEQLPLAVEVGGKSYAIYTGHRDWMRFETMMHDTELTDAEKYALMFDWYKDDPPTDAGAAVRALLTFYGGAVGESINGGDETPQTRVYDFQKDAGRIHAAFMQAYRIDLSSMELHWWSFLALLCNVPESTRLAQVMSIRAADTSGMSATEKKRYAELKRLYALADTAPKPQTAAQRDTALVGRLRKRKERISNSGV